MSDSCLICGDSEAECTLHSAPCGNHYYCVDCLADHFKHATSNERLYPAQCCGAMFLSTDWEGILPHDVMQGYQSKEKGEYSIMKKYRVYCGNPSCAKFIHPVSNVSEAFSTVTYAVCEFGCGHNTCVECRNVINDDPASHTCTVTEADQKFKDAAEKEGYQECPECGHIVELADACNHIECVCGASFCYVCGADWVGMHGCPHYGKAIYDEDGYNESGYHKTTHLNREG
ncbi:hypothetical protein K504DRAFT_355681, partial [Pleomassaria siparia CBS 279.74]